MAEHRAKRDARRLLKTLTIQTHSDKGQRSAKGQSSNGVRGQVGGKERDVLAEKYEELGRLLAMQYIEKKAFSSINGMDLQLQDKNVRSSRSVKKCKPQENGKPKQRRSRKRKNHVANKNSGYVFIKMPPERKDPLEKNTFGSKSTTHEFYDGENFESLKCGNHKTRPKTGRKGDKYRNHRRSSHEEVLYGGESFNGPGQSHRSDSESSQTCSSPSVSISIEESIEEVEFVNRSSMKDLPPKTFAQKGEVFFKRDVNNEPILVLQGEIELQESVRVGTPDISILEEVIEEEEISRDKGKVFQDEQEVFRDENEGFGDREGVDKNTKDVFRGQNKDYRDRNEDFYGIDKDYLEDSLKKEIFMDEKEISKERETLTSARRKVSFASDVECNEEEEEMYPEKHSKSVSFEEKVLQDILSPRSTWSGGEGKAKFKNEIKKRKKKRNKINDGHLNSSLDEDKTKGPVKSKSQESLKESPNSSPRKSPRKMANISLSDHKLSQTDNEEIKKWLRRKNSLMRQKKREERLKEQEKRRKEEEKLRAKTERLRESRELVRDWMNQKRAVDAKKRKDEKKDRKLKEMDEEKRKELLSGHLYSSEYRARMQGNNRSLPKKDDKAEKKTDLQNGEIGSSKVVKRKVTKKKSDASSKEKNGSALVNGKGDDGKQVKARMSYQDWLKKKRDIFKRNNKIGQGEGAKTDPELEKIIPNLAQKRIERATSIRGKRREVVEEVNSDSELPESEREMKNPYVLPETDDIDRKLNELKTQQRKTRPSSARNVNPGLQRPRSAKPDNSRLLSTKSDTKLSSVISSKTKPRKLHEVQDEKLNEIVKRFAWDDKNRGLTLEDTRTSEDSGIASQEGDGVVKGVQEKDKNERFFLTEAQGK